MNPTLPPDAISEGQRLPAEIFENAAPSALPPPVPAPAPAPAPAPPAQPVPAEAVEDSISIIESDDAAIPDSLPADGSTVTLDPTPGAGLDPAIVAPPIVEQPAPPAGMLSGIGDILLAANKDIALILLAAGCFFFGVILSVLTPGREEGHGRATAVAAPMTFLLTAPLWFPLLSGGLIKTSIAPIDSILAYAIDGSIRGQMFAFGVVMVIGYHAAAVFRLIDKVFKGLLSFIASKAPKAPPAAPDGG